MIQFFKAAYSAFQTWVAANPKTWAYIKALPMIAQGVQAHRTNMKLKKGQDILLTKFGTGDGIPVVYGTRRVAGTVVFMETVANKELFVVYALAVGEVENISDLRIDGRSINDKSVYRQGYVLRKEGNYFGGTVASENTVDIGNVLGGAGGDNPRMVFNLHHGATDQEADPMLFHVFDGTNSRPNSWSSDHKLSGIAYIAANYEYDTQGMFTGIPNLTAVVKGKKVLDTRTETTAWSDNPALILHDYLTNDEYGKGLPTSAIDTTSFNTAANDCETDIQTISHTNVEVTSASTTTDRVILASGTAFDKIKTGSTISFVADSTTYFSGKVVDKDSTNFLYDEADTYGRTFTLTLADGSVTTAITSSTTGTITETQDRFETNAVINTNQSVLENAKDLIANMRGIFTYTNGTYSIKVEGTETPVLNLYEDDILETGIEFSIENKEQKYNRVEVEFYNSSKDYEADTVVVEHSATPEFYSDDGDEVLEHRAQFPHVTNQRIAYNHANAILNRSRNNRTIAFVATPKVLKSKVGEVITITSSDLDLSQEQYRITQMTIQPDLNIQVSAVEYQGDVYGWNDPPEEDIERPDLPPDPFRVEAPTNININQKSGQTPAYLSWDDASAYPSFKFRVKIYDDINQGGTIVRDQEVQDTRLYLPQLPKQNGYSAEVFAINTLGIESDPGVINDFDITVDPVINDDIADDTITATKLNVDNLAAITADLGIITSGSISIDTSASIKKFQVSTSLVKIGSGIDEPQLRIATGNVTNALTFASESGEDGDKVSFALDDGGTITEKAFIKTDTGSASFQNLTFKGNLISGTTTVLTSARQLQNIASLDSTTTTTIQNAVGGGTGDITAVTAGTNLTGGGTTGDVTLNLATNLSDLGTISSQTISPTTTATYGLGTANNVWNYLNVNQINIGTPGVTVLDSSRNLTNIASFNSSSCALTVGTISSGGITTSDSLTITGNDKQVKFTGTTGPFGLEFGDSEANPNFRIYYRTATNTLTFENSGETARHTFDLDGDYTAEGTVTATSFSGDGSALTGITSTTINNNADNRVITGSNTADTLNGEANLTYDGITLEMDSTSSPILRVQTTQTSNQDALLELRGARTASSTSDIAKIKFDNKTSSAYTMAEITARDPSGSHTLGRGSLIFRTSNGGTLSDALLIARTGGATFYSDLTTNGNFTTDGTISSGAITATGTSTFDATDIGQIEIGDGGNNSTSDARNIGSKSNYLLIQRNQGVPIELWGSRIESRTTHYFGGGSSDAEANIDTSGNFTTTGTISSGAITASGDITANSGFVKISGSSASEGGELQLLRGTSGTTDINIDNYQNYLRVHSGGSVWMDLESTGINTASYQVSGTTVIDASRNLTNIGTITTSDKINVGNASTSGRNMVEIQTNDNTADRGIAFRNSGNAFSNAIFAENVGGNDARLVFCCGNSTSNLGNLQRSFMVDNQSGGGGVSGDIHARGDVVAFSSTISSDERLKYDIEDIKNPLDIIQSLKGRHFKWKKNDQKSSGVIAQEVEQSEMSFLVSDKVNIDNPDETIKRVKYDGFIGVLIEAIKEQQKQIDELKAKLK